MARLSARTGCRFSAWTALALLAIAFAGCLGGDTDSSPLSIDVVPLGAAQAGEPLDVEVHVSGQGTPSRIGVAWAAATTGLIPRGQLAAEAFDGLAWGPAGARELPSTTTLRIDAVPAIPAIYLRGVAETEDGPVWGNESRIAVAAIPPPLPLEVRLFDMPTQAYPREPIAFTLNVTGWNGVATEAGVAWGATTNLGRDPDNLRPDHYGEALRANGSLQIPLTHVVTDWTTTLNDTVFLRGWVRVGEEWHWSTEHRLAMTEPPAVDNVPGPADHVKRIAPGLVPLAQLATFTPQTLTVRVGESVQWENQDGATHTASHVGGESEDEPVWFHTGNMGAGTTSKVFRFLVPGEYPYECRIHPMTMQGTIHVET